VRSDALVEHFAQRVDAVDAAGGSGLFLRMHSSSISCKSRQSASITSLYCYICVQGLNSIVLLQQLKFYYLDRSLKNKAIC